MITPRAEITGRRGYWLLDLDLGGRVLRFSTLPLTVARSDGQELSYAEGLSELTVSAVSVDGQEISAAVDIAGDVNWSTLVSQGVTLSRRAATLRRWYEGQVFERARVIVDGLTFDPVYGAADEPFSVTISQRRVATAGKLPASAAAVSADTWPVTGGYTRNEAIGDAAYPLIIGYPGITESAAGALPATPALLAEGNFVSAISPSTLIVAGHPIEASEVELWSLKELDASTGLTRHDVFSITEKADALGRVCSVIAIDGTAAPNFSTERVKQHYYTGISTNGVAVSGGIANAAYSGPLRGAGEVLIWALSNYSDMKLDTGRMEAQRQYLDRIKIDTFINQRVSAWDWVSANILALLPVSEVEGSDGLYFQFWRWDASAVDAVAHLDADRLEIERLSRVEALDQDILNEIEIRYQPVCNSSSEYHASRVISGAVADGDRVLVDYGCKLSQQAANYGIRPATIDAPVLWDTASAVQILQWKAAQYALPKRIIRYSAAAETESLEVGQVVTLTDSEISLAAAPCLIREINITPTGCELLLIVLDNPVISKVYT